jgi:DNA/RNA endonuclease YhcR with UshA esterase domain
MKTLYGILFGFLLLVAMAATQQQKQSDMAVPAYSTSQEQAFSGTILEVKDYQCPVTGTIGSHIAVKGTSDTLEVHLAPAKFLKQYDIVLKPGDQVTVTGIKFTFDGKPAMLARLVVVGRDTFRFRDDKGRPEW